VIGPNLSEWAIRSRALTIYLMIVAVLAGGFAFANLGRDEDPTFTIKVMLVAAVWPGATMEEQLSQVTERLERTLQETPGLDSVRSITRPGVTTIFVDLLGAWPPEEVPDSWYHVRKSVADIRHTLPQGVVGPFFNDEFGDVFGIIYGFTADGFDQRELLDYVDAARSTLLREVEGIAKIEFIGVQDERIFIELAPDRVAALGLDYGQIFAAVAAQNVVRPSGTISTGLENVAPGLRRLRERARRARGRDQRRRADDPARRHRRRAPRLRRPALAALPRERRAGDRPCDLPAAGRRRAGARRDVRAAMDRITADLPIGIEPFLVNDQPAVVDASIGDFTTSLYQAVAIILAVSFLAIGLRPGAMVAIAIPVTLATVFLVMQTLGIDLHRVSLGALIIALALLVDDAMTTTDAMLRRLAVGDPIDKAATFAYRTLAAPMLTGTLITIAGFVPIGFAESQAGEYTISLFQVIAIALIASWMVAVLFTPIVGGFLLKPPKPGDRGGAAGLPRAPLRAAAAPGDPCAGGRDRGGGGALRAVGDRAAAGRPAVLPRLRPQRADRRPAAAALELDLRERDGGEPDRGLARRERGRRLLERLHRLERHPLLPAARHREPVGPPVADRGDGDRPRRAPAAGARPRRLSHRGVPRGDREGQPARDGPADRLAGAVPAERPGPRGAAARGLRACGRDRGPSRRATGALRLDRAGAQADHRRRPGPGPAAGADQPGALGGAQHRRLGRADHPAARRHLPRRRGGAGAFPGPGDARWLATLQVPVPGGRTVALASFATFAYEQEQPLVRRRDRVPTLTVLADVGPGVTPEAVVAGIEADIAALDADLPAGYRIELGGTAEQSAQSSESVFAVVPLMLFIMLTLLMVQLQNFWKVGMVIVLFPLGLIGVVLALLTFGRPLGFVAILGILALLGMIAKNAVILLVQIKDETARGLNVPDAVIVAATGRLRPIMLTVLSTVLGLMPIAPTLFWGPMAIAIMGGLWWRRC
jgi:multidrug efflux pump